MPPKTKSLALFALLTFLLTSGAACRITAPETKEKMQPVTLEYWRVWDEKDDFNEILARYKALRPHVNINLRFFTYPEYENALLYAYAGDRAPDLLSLHNTWLRKYQSQNKLSPLPAKITMPATIVSGPSWHRETKIVLQDQPGLSFKKLQADFVEVVPGDVYLDNKIYGLPLGLDTLILFYNKDILAQEGIVYPAQNWSEFNSHVQRMVKEDKNSNIVIAGAALGTGRNVTRASDIISLLMLQSGVQMTGANGRPAFHLGEDKGEGPASRALTYYTDFASPATAVYTWNKSQPESIEAFIQGRAAYFIGYSYHINYIKNRAPKLNFAVAKIPQIEGAPEINYTNYWAESVSEKSNHKNEAWDFIMFAASEQNVRTYLESAQKPTALRNLIDVQKENLVIGDIVSQSLTAKSWYHGYNANAMEDFLKEMIDTVVDGGSVPAAIITAARKIDQTI